MFCIYLIMCNRERTLPALDKLLYCTYAIITEKDFRGIMDVPIKAEVD